MENFGDLMSVPPMHRDIGSTFLAYQMPMQMYGMPYATGYGVSPMKASLTYDKFETINGHKEKQKSEIKKTLGILGGVATALLAFVVLKKKVPAVNKAFKKVLASCKKTFKTVFAKPKAKARKARAPKNKTANTQKTN